MPPGNHVLYPVTRLPQTFCALTRRAAELFERHTGGWTLHQLRHSALTHAAEAGANTATLLAYSGHTSVVSLARYARVSPEALTRWQTTRDRATRRRLPATESP